MLHVLVEQDPLVHQQQRRQQGSEQANDALWRPFWGQATGEVTSVLHRCGHALHLPSPMNREYLHAVPKRKRVKACRISLTFREIVS